MSNGHFITWKIINILYHVIENKFINLMVTSEYGVNIEKMDIQPLKPLNKVLGVKYPFFHVQGVGFLEPTCKKSYYTSFGWVKIAC